MNRLEFLMLGAREQCEVLGKLADEAVKVLSNNQRVWSIATEALARCRSYLSESTPASTVAQFLNHEDANQDLSAMYDFVDEDVASIAAIDIVVYATGATARCAFNDQKIEDGIPDPVLLATPESVADAFLCYSVLYDGGHVPEIDKVLS